jgi:hypothetical protein
MAPLDPFSDARQPVEVFLFTEVRRSFEALAPDFLLFVQWPSSGDWTKAK